MLTQHKSYIKHRTCWFYSLPTHLVLLWSEIYTRMTRFWTSHNHSFQMTFFFSTYVALVHNIVLISSTWRERTGTDKMTRWRVDKMFVSLQMKQQPSLLQHHHHQAQKYSNNVTRYHLLSHNKAILQHCQFSSENERIDGMFLFIYI